MLAFCFWRRYRTRLNKCSYCLQAYRLEIPDLNTYIDLPARNLPTVMYVAVDEPAAVINRPLFKIAGRLASASTYSE